MKFISHNLEETNKIAQGFVKEINSFSKEKALVVGLYGNLGSGKTAFTKGVAKAFDLKEIITSPTFVLEKIYKISNSSIFKKLIHIDAYRLEKEEDLLGLDWENILKNSQNIIFIEWPERVSSFLPDDMLEIHFKFVDAQTREINIKNFK